MVIFCIDVIMRVKIVCGSENIASIALKYSLFSTKNMTTPTITIFVRDLPNSTRPGRLKSRDQPLAMEIRENCGRMRSSTGVGRFCEMDATTPNTMHKMKACDSHAGTH